MAKNAQPTFQTKLSETSGGKINDVVKPNGCCIPDLWKKFPRVNDPKAKKIISMNREKLFSMVKQASSRAEEKDLSVIIMMDVNKVSALDCSCGCCPNEQSPQTAGHFTTSSMSQNISIFNVPKLWFLLRKIFPFLL